MTAPEPTGITDRTVELWTAGQLPRPNLTCFTKAEAFEEGFERGQAHGRSEVLGYLVGAGYITETDKASVEWGL